MKHDLKITLILVLFFLASQYVGLFITSQYITIEKVIDISTGEQTYNVTNVSKLPMGVERMEVSEDFSWVWIIIAILFGTILVLVLAKFRQRKIWRFWYFFSLVLIMTFALGPFLGDIPALVLSAILAIFKTYKPNFVIHNLTEIFLYGGLAAMLVPIMNVFAVFMLLIAISIYDAIAVWKSKHMITLANFQSDSNLFAGLFIPYKSDKETSKNRIVLKLSDKSSSLDGGDIKNQAREINFKKKLNENVKKKENKPLVSRAILGGGDIAFPLIFTGVIMKTVGFSSAALIPPFTALALFILLYKSEKGKFYPAMPFISLGCIAGYLVVVLSGLLF